MTSFGDKLADTKERKSSCTRCHGAHHAVLGEMLHAPAPKTWTERQRGYAAHNRALNRELLVVGPVSKRPVKKFQAVNVIACEVCHDIFLSASAADVVRAALLAARGNAFKRDRFADHIADVAAVVLVRLKKTRGNLFALRDPKRTMKRTVMTADAALSDPFFDSVHHRHRDQLSFQ